MGSTTSQMLDFDFGVATLDLAPGQDAAVALALARAALAGGNDALEAKTPDPADGGVVGCVARGRVADSPETAPALPRPSRARPRATRRGADGALDRPTGVRAAAPERSANATVRAAMLV